MSVVSPNHKDFLQYRSGISSKQPDATERGSSGEIYQQKKCSYSKLTPCPESTIPIPQLTEQLHINYRRRIKYRKWVCFYGWTQLHHPSSLKGFTVAPTRWFGWILYCFFPPNHIGVFYLDMMQQCPTLSDTNPFLIVQLILRV